MLSIQKNFAKIIIYKKKKFKIKNILLLNNLVLKCFLKKSIFYRDEKKDKYGLQSTYDMYNLLKYLETLSFKLPKVKNVSLKYVDKKKKKKTRIFIKIDSIIDRNSLNFLDSFLSIYYNNYISYVNSFYKKSEYLEEIIVNNVNNKIKLGLNYLIFNINFNKNFFKFSDKFMYIHPNSEKQKSIHDYYANIKFKINSDFINYFYKVVFYIIINSYKLNIFLYKKFLKKDIKI